jgi:hypothetical protein
MISEEEVMNINYIVTGLFVLLILYYNWKVKADPIPSELPWVPIQVGKARSFVNQVRDAGMFTEMTRRQAVIGNPDGRYGSLDFLLTGICVCPPKDVCPPAPDVVWYGENADDDVCDIVDAGGAAGMYDIVNFGTAEPNACDT